MAKESRVALVTGGARGIGLGIARCLAEAGYALGLVDLDGEQAQRSAAELPTTALALTVDASEEGAMADACDRVARELGGLDVMVNNAGAGTAPPSPEDLVPVPPITNVTQESWDAQIQNNLRTTFVGCKAAVPHLRRRGGGAIVNIASIAGLMPSVTLPAYGAAKAAVIHLTRTLALELATADIRVNAICPGFVWTRAWELMATFMKAVRPEFAELEPREIFLRICAERVPLRREQTPEDMGRLVVFLASEEARNITGQEIKIDGGITLGEPVA